MAINLIIFYFLVSIYNLEFSQGLNLILIGCAAGTLIDLDHLLYAFLAFKKNAWKYIKKGILDPKGLIEEFGESGKLFFHGTRRMILHCITMSSIYGISLYFFPSYSLVIGIAFITHLILDIDPRWLFA
ncbi:MAG: hypothetical protein QW228_06915 [Candidatus Aenigmatarchaeota archaeon]